MKTTKLSTIIGAVLAVTVSHSVLAGHHDTKIDTSFTKLDANKDGFVMASEVNGMFKSKTFTMMDIDGDDRVSRDEFSLFVDKNPSLFSDALITKVRTAGTTDAVLIKRGDAELLENKGSKMISEKNKALRSETSIMAENRFSQLDIDSDGKLTSTEVEVAKMQASFDDMDENDDSVVTRTEYRTYFEEIESE